MTHLSFFRLPIRGLMAMATVVALALPSFAAELDKVSQTSIKSVMTFIAKDAKGWMDQKGKSEISVGNITQPPGVTTGQGIAETLKQNLRLENLIVKLGNAPNYIEGRVNKDLKAGQMVFQFTIYDESGEAVHQIPKQVLPLVETVVQGGEGTDKVTVTGTNGDAMLAGGITAPGKATVQQLAKPEALVGIDGNQVFAKGAEAYRIEVLQKSAAGDEYQPFTPEIKDGFAVVKMPSDTIYGVRIINQSDEDVAVILEVDGVNFFFLCDAKSPTKLVKKGNQLVPATLADGDQALGPAYSHYVLNKKDDVLIKGWYKNEEKAFEFHATEDPELQKIAPGKIVASDQAKIGTITAQFYRAWDAATPASQPNDSVLASRFLKKSRTDPKPVLATVPGAETEVKSTLRQVQWEEQNRATVSVRYEK